MSTWNFPFALSRSKGHAKPPDPGKEGNYPIILLMARGWESKSVESQVESSKEERNGERRQLTQEQREAAQQRQGLQLSRSYLLRQLAASTSQRYTALLQQALTEIEEKLARLEKI